MSVHVIEPLIVPGDSLIEKGKVIRRGGEYETPVGM